MRREEYVPKHALLCMIDYMLEGEGFNIRDTQMCRKLAVEICEYFLEMYFGSRQEE